MNKEHLQNIANYLKNKYIKIYNLKDIIIEVKPLKGSGRASYSSRFISIPLWAYTEGIHFFIAYVLHELSHFINNDKNYIFGHGKEFHCIERFLLKEYRLNPVYSKAYIKKLYSDNGIILWPSKRIKTNE